jgi:hypothetical protein
MRSLELQVNFRNVVALLISSNNERAIGLTFCEEKSFPFGSVGEQSPPMNA